MELRVHPKMKWEEYEAAPPWGRCHGRGALLLAAKGPRSVAIQEADGTMPIDLELTIEHLGKRPPVFCAVMTPLWFLLTKCLASASGVDS